MTNLPGEQWMTSNSTDGSIFIDDWCCHCERDKPCSEGKDFDECSDSEICQILAASFCGEAVEWRRLESGETVCTAFIEYGQPAPLLDTQTIDMFEGFKP